MEARKGELRDMLIDFDILFKKQKELDLEIQKNHNVTYSDTMKRRFLALFVEIGELANATRCFKYWSNKVSESKERVMDEYADGLHFLLSLGIALDIKETSYEYLETSKDLSALFIKMYEEISLFEKERSLAKYNDCFKAYLNIAYKLGMSKDDIFSSYLLKLGENYHRQETNY